MTSNKYLNISVAAPWRVASDRMAGFVRMHNLAEAWARLSRASREMSIVSVDWVKIADFKSSMRPRHPFEIKTGTF